MKKKLNGRGSRMEGFSRGAEPAMPKVHQKAKGIYPRRLFLVTKNQELPVWTCSTSHSFRELLSDFGLGI